MRDSWPLHLAMQENNKQAVLGLGLGLGLGLTIGLGVLALNTNNIITSRSASPLSLDSDLLLQIIDGKENNTTFNDFPYYLNEQTKALLINAAFVNLKQAKHTKKFTANLSPASKTILLTGPSGAEIYHQMLAKALAHSFEAKLLLLDVSDFSLKAKLWDLRYSVRNSRITYNTTKASSQKVDRHAESSGNKEQNPEDNQEERRNSVTAHALGDSDSRPGKALKRSASFTSEYKRLLTALLRVLSSQNGPIILYLRDVEHLILKEPQTHSLFRKFVQKVSGPVLILGSRQEGNKSCPENRMLAEVFTYNIEIKPPEDDARLTSWKSQLEEGMRVIETKDNRNYISEILSENDVICDDLSFISFNDTALLGKHMEEIIMSAISHHLMNTEEPEYRDGRLVISDKSLGYGLSLFKAGQLDGNDSKVQLEGNPEISKDHHEANLKTEGKNDALEVKVEVGRSDVPKADISKAETSKKGEAETKPTAKPEAPADNEFEKRIRPEVIPAGEVGVRFDDIGALENVKEALQELVMLPLRRPDLFNRGGLLKPCKGILLFGPPGTGKTMLAKAVATEAGASFINVSMSTITSKWFGEDEKNVRALFTLAAKVAPTVIFIDEVDSMLGQRSRVGEHEAMRKIKNEFMAHWDGLLTKSGERVLVLAATNRPFDLDDAIIRRFERRIMVGLPTAESREKILRAILSKEKLENDFDFKELISITEGYSGSDLKNLCVTAAYYPIRELLKEEQQEEKFQEEEKSERKQKKVIDEKHSADSQKEEKAGADVETENSDSSTVTASEKAPRPLTMKDMRRAKEQVSASFAAEGAGMAELQEWNELFGEGGCRKKQQLTYFL